jgi:hypothetical protein
MSEETLYRFRSEDPASPPLMAWYLFRDPIFLLAAAILMFRQFMTPKLTLQSAGQLERTPTEQ